MDTTYIRALGKIETAMAYNHQFLNGNTQGCQMVKISCAVSDHQIRHAANLLFDEYQTLRVTLDYSSSEIMFKNMSNFSKIPIEVVINIESFSWVEFMENNVNNIIDPEISMWRLNVYIDSKENTSYINACFHHSIVDGSGVVIFLKRLLSILDNLITAPNIKHAIANAKPFPPSIDNYLKEKSSILNTTAKPKTNKKIYHDTNNAPISSRKTHMEVLSIDGSHFTNFIEHCKKKKLSINGVLSSTLLKACHASNTFEESIELKSAVSLRDRTPYISDDQHSLGCYITVANGSFSVDQETTIDSLCKSYDTQLFSAMLKNLAFINPASDKDIKTNIAGMKNIDYFSHGLGITNAGIVEDDVFCEFEIMDWQTINNRCGGNICIVLHVIQINSRINLGFVYSTPLIMQDKVKNIVKAFEKEIGINTASL